ncbi:MAG: hypothetical protein IJ242_14905 [Clostridia bacterium]|nr:hypothetical protein [Clostridia bacterium]
MTRKAIFCILFCLFLIPLPASAQEKEHIPELRSAAPERWTCEIRTKEGKTVTIDAPVHIPDVNAVPLMRVCKNYETYELAGDESFLIGKADTRKRDEIYDPDPFPDIRYPPEDLITFMQEIRSSNGGADADLIPYRVTALGPMYHVKSGKVFSRKHSFPASIADTANPWKHDATRGYRMITTQRIVGMPVFLSGTAASEISSMQTYSCITYINREHYALYIRTVTIEEIFSPDVQLLSFNHLQGILTERIVDGTLQEILEINLGYLCMGQDADEQKDALSCQLIPVWQVRGYDTYLDPVHDGILSMLSLEDPIKYDPEMIYSIYIDAVTGEQIPAIPAV